MDRIERIKLVKAMEYIARNINDEDVFYEWLLDGVADGDIEDGSLDVGSDDLEILDYYVEDDHFAELMQVFLHIMARAKKSGGLYCDGVVSKRDR